MSEEYILTLDQGTTSSRAVVFNKESKIVSMEQQELKQYFPKPGWVEHDPMEIWSSQMAVASHALLSKGINPEQITALGITNQRETTLIWEKDSGKPLHFAIVWQDRRTAKRCDELRRSGYTEMVRDKTGLEIDAYFSATKIEWLLDRIPDARKRAAKGELAFGTVDSWLIWNLTGGRSHLTDVTNASRTLLFNIHKLEWDEDLLRLFNIPAELLPEVRPTSAYFGHTAGRLLRTEIPICGVAGDQQAALFGQMCNRKGMVKNTYGTGCFLMMNTGNEPVSSANRLITTIAWQIGNKITYALEGSVFAGGAVVQLLRDGFQMIDSAGEIESLAASVEDTAGVYFVPAFNGLGAPYWNPNAAGLITGIHRGTKKAHLARAALESIAYQSNDVMMAMRTDTGVDLERIRVDGGAAVNNLLMQMQADISQAIIERSVTEATSQGVAYFAGLEAGFWKDPAALEKLWTSERTFTPQISGRASNDITRGWHSAIRRSMNE